MIFSFKGPENVLYSVFIDSISKKWYFHSRVLNMYYIQFLLILSQTLLFIFILLTLIPVAVLILHLFGFPVINVMGVTFFERCSSLLILSSLCYRYPLISSSIHITSLCIFFDSMVGTTNLTSPNFQFQVLSN